MSLSKSTTIHWMPTVDTKTKLCNHCRQEKEITAFYACKRMKDGYFNQCKQCTKQKAKIWAKENPEKRKDVYTQYHRDKRGCVTREEYDKNRKENAIGRQASVFKYSSKRRQQKKRVPCEFTDFVAEEAAALCKLRQKTTGITWHVDHIVPLNHRKACGLHLWTNLQVVPDYWNFRKGNRTMCEWNYT